MRELFHGGGLKAMLKLLPLYLFVAMFWALFDQTGSTWIFQSQDMDRHFLGFEWLPSQIQSLNSVFVLTFIPIFAYAHLSVRRPPVETHAVAQDRARVVHHGRLVRAGGADPALD